MESGGAMGSKPFVAGREERAPLRVLFNGAGAAVISAPCTGRGTGIHRPVVRKDG
ncbi:hypothetical protein GCM10009525_05380 [Streptosporangium amethystogenes subsp. fukuiense]